MPDAPTARRPAAALAPKDVAARMKVKVDNVLAWIASGELRAANVAKKSGGRPRWRIDPSDLQVFIGVRSGRPVKVPRTKRRPAGDVIKFF